MPWAHQTPHLVKGEDRRTPAGAVIQTNLDVDVTYIGGVLIDVEKEGSLEAVRLDSEPGLNAPLLGRVQQGLLRMPIAHHSCDHPASRFLSHRFGQLTSGAAAAPVDGTPRSFHG